LFHGSFQVLSALFVAVDVCENTHYRKHYPARLGRRSALLAVPCPGGPGESYWYSQWKNDQSTPYATLCQFGVLSDQPYCLPMATIRLISVSAAARHLRISRQRVGYLCRRYSLGFVIGRTRILTASDYRRLATCRRPAKVGRFVASRQRNRFSSSAPDLLEKRSALRIQSRSASGLGGQKNFPAHGDINLTMPK
jgi:hypothetical protein